MFRERKTWLKPDKKGTEKEVTEELF